MRKRKLKYPINKPMMIGCQYLQDVLWSEGLVYRIKVTTSFLRKLDKTNPFSAIAVRGSSGLLVGPAVAANLNKHLLLIRKPRQEEPSHSWELVSGPQLLNNYVIVDDFVETGNTIKKILEEVRKKYGTGDGQACIGVVSYMKDYIDTDVEKDIGVKLLNNGRKEFKWYPS